MTTVATVTASFRFRATVAARAVRPQLSRHGGRVAAASASLCESRVWAPEHGDDCWLDCTRRSGHRRLHRAGHDSWETTEAIRSVQASARAAARRAEREALPSAAA